MISNVFIEIDSFRYSKHDRPVNGDVTLTRKLPDGRVVSILCDGLGSGVEANVLASFTASMGIEYMQDEMTITRAAELIMDALPLCPSRKISYSTFSIADLSTDGELRMIEHGNPPFFVFRDSSLLPVNSQELYRKRWQNRKLDYVQLKIMPGDRVVLMSDGVTQAGIGGKKWPMGCGIDHVTNHIEEQIRLTPDVSASRLCRLVCDNALVNDCFFAGDDITCLVMYFRKPRILRVLTGPPLDTNRDQEFADLLRNWNGMCAICGGTTANIIERELGRSAVVNLGSIDPVVPATSDMDGIDLVTEGCITLGQTLQLLEKKLIVQQGKNGAQRLVNLFMSSDIIEFYVGTRINQAHQDPDLPIELDIRRNVLKNICAVLEKEYYKTTITRYL